MKKHMRESNPTKPADPTAIPMIAPVDKLLDEGDGVLTVTVAPGVVVEAEETRRPTT